MVRTKKKSSKKGDPDFKKKIKKVGKSTRPENATTTSFRTKTISLPSSLRRIDRKNEILTQHGQSLQDLVAKISHYNDNMRADAARGITALVEAHPAMLAQAAVLLTIIERSAPLMSDTSFRVRKEGCILLSRVANVCDESDLTPYFPLLMAHTSSAMTSLDVSVREDSLKFVDVWLTYTPHLVSSMGHRLLDNFVQLISFQTRNLEQVCLIV